MNSSPYLPSFLMGDPQAPTPPRSNTLSPNKGRNLSFVTSPGTPQDYNRTMQGPKTLFGAYQQPPASASADVGNFPNTPLQNHNASASGPPTQGLFDTLRSERAQVETPTRGFQPSVNLEIFGGSFNVNQSYLQQSQQLSQYNDSILGNGSFNASNSVLSPHVPQTSAMLASSLNNTSHAMPGVRNPRINEFWVTVFGFPPTAAGTILQHFAQCGVIVEKVFPSQNGNWVHIKYSSRLERDKALNYHEKIIGNNIMIGVTHCKDRNITDKENNTEPNVTCQRTAVLKNMPMETAVVVSQNVPQKSTGLMNKAMDLFFGW